MGNSVATAKQMATYLLSKNSNPQLSRNISAIDFCQMYLDICAKENVRGDVAFAQALKETGHFKYGGDVKAMQNNFCGLGATGGVHGCVFSSIEKGILAQAQHLKTYATKDPLNESCVDPRRTSWFVNSKGGTASEVEDLGGTWAVPGYDTKKYNSLDAANKAKDSYGYQIVDLVNDILKIKTNDKKEEIQMSNPVLALSAGHGLYTAGKRCAKTIDPNETREWYLNDRIADKVEVKLKAYNCTVIRVNDTTGKVDTALATRAKTSDNANADFYLAIHHNAGVNGGSGGGTTVHYYSAKAERKTQAQQLYNEIIKQTGLVGNRSAKVIKSNFYECRVPKAPSLLVENGFMDSRTDVPIILSEAHAEKTAVGIVNFLVNELKLTKNGTVVKDTTVAVQKPSTPVAANMYEVQAGDTMSKIGAKTGVPWKTIAELNGIKFPYAIKKGQMLKLTNEVVNSTTASIASFQVKLKEDMTIRKTPEVKPDNIVKKNGAKKNNVYTIVEVRGDWGLLMSYQKNRNGWICIADKYVHRV